MQTQEKVGAHRAQYCLLPLQVGACIVKEYGSGSKKQTEVVGIGYNAMPEGEDCKYPWKKKSDRSEHTKYPYGIRYSPGQ